MLKRRIVIIAWELVLLLLCGFLMVKLQSRLFYRNADREIELTLEDTDRIVAQTDENASDTYDSYELIHQAKAKMARYYIRNDVDTGYSTISMSNLKNLLNVSNVLLVDKDGKTITYAAVSSAEEQTQEDSPFLPLIEEIAGTDKVSSVDYFLMEGNKIFGEKSLYSACLTALDENYYVVIEDDAMDLYELQDESLSWNAVLPRITLGKNGFVFSVETDGFVSAFSDPDEEQITDISGLGIGMEALRDGFRGTLILEGDSYYCGIKFYEDQQLYIICAIPSEEITSGVLALTAVPFFAAFIFLSLQLLYAVMLTGEWDGADEKGRTVSFRMFLAKRMVVLLVLSVVFTVASSVYTQVLYAMFIQAESNKKEMEALSESLQRNEEVQKKTSEKYYSDLENLATLAARFLSNNPRLVTREDLAEIAGNLGAEHILLYDESGTAILSDAYYRGLRISSNPHELSYEFKKVLTGTPVYVQQKVDESYLDKPYRYAGAIITDEKDELKGFVQLAFSPDYLQMPLNASAIETLPSTFSGRNNAFVFIVDGEKQTFLYYPKEKMINDPVEDYGLTEEMMQDGYISRTGLDGEERLLYCGFWEENMIFTAASVNAITFDCLNRGIYISFAGIFVQLLCFIIILLSFGRKEAGLLKTPEERVFDDSGKKRIEALAAERILRLFKSSFLVFSGVICVSMLFKDVLFQNNTVLLNLLNGYWNTGVHVFSITACGIYSCMIFFVMELLLFVLELTGKLMNSRGETIIRMLISFARYIAVIGVIFYCANLLGAPTGTLLASAGILSIVIGLGAQSLVTDVLAGLFIIFEKAFKVGDIVRIDSWRGRVLEIGIRNTRFRDIDENSIKIVHNSSLNEIVNLSDLPTCIYTTIGTEYGEELLRVEEILRKELPEIKKRIPEAIEGPRYSGVSELGDSAVILKFMTVCRNENYYRVRFAVNRELKLLFDKYGIQVPFPQIVLNQREEN